MRLKAKTGTAGHRNCTYRGNLLGYTVKFGVRKVDLERDSISGFVQ